MNEHECHEWRNQELHGLHRELNSDAWLVNVDWRGGSPGGGTFSPSTYIWSRESILDHVFGKIFEKVAQVVEAEEHAVEDFFYLVVRCGDFQTCCNAVNQPGGNGVLEWRSIWSIGPKGLA